MNKKIILLTIVSILLSSCGGVTPVPTVTSTFAPTLTATATHQPTVTPTVTRSVTDGFFVIPTMHPYTDSTPLSLVTPSDGYVAARLEDISEEGFLNLIHDMNEYSYQNYPPILGWWYEGRFVSSQKSIALAIQEFLYRFPESSKAERLKWQLAFINSIMNGSLAGNQYGDEWILSELQNSLTIEQLPPDQLDAVLEQYWFEVAYLQPVENLFGDGKIGWLYVIVPQVWDEEEISENQDHYWHGGLFVVVREVHPRDYQVLLLNSAWGFSFADSYIFDVSDHNLSGQPEIALYIGTHSGTMCGGNLLIYEWADNEFVELTRNKIGLGDCIESIEYSQSGHPAIVHSGIFPKRTEVYTWNGNFYEFGDYTDLSPLEGWRTFYAGQSLSYADEVKILSEALASGEATKYGSSYPDYLRYRLGVAYAFQSKSGDAIRVFEDLISVPVDKTRDIFPRMASKFVGVYSDGGSIYKACFESLLEYKELLDYYGISSYDVDSETRQNILGFSFDSYDLYVFPTCDLEDAFSIAVNLIPVTVEDVITELRKHDVKLDYSEKIDADLDGKTEEQVVVFDTYSWFLVYPNGSHFSAKKLSAPNEYKPDAQVRVENWNTIPNPVMSIFSGDELTILEIGENYEPKSLLSEFGVRDYHVLDMDPVPQLELLFDKPQTEWSYPDYPWDGYRWDDGQGMFRNDLLEYQLFVLGDPQKAIRIVDNLVPVLDDWKEIPDIEIWPLPYTYYISGLVYELSGDQQKAIQIYWQLWRDFPESHYALLAKYKLELANP